MGELPIKRFGYVLYAILVTILNIIRILLIWTKLFIIKTFPNMVNKKQFVQNVRRIKQEILLELSKATKMGKY
tara:strand:- start:2172 stop:2390 length:219 start_codon:yes stop_codon:yes gene_type:complete